MKLNITVPVYNEESILADNLARLHAFAAASLRCSWQIVVADNGSTDRTLKVAKTLERTLSNTSVMHLDLKGRGYALKAAWERYPAEVLSYMDADLSSDLAALPILLSALARRDSGEQQSRGDYDLAIGSRLLAPKMTTRGLRREVISRLYNLLLKAVFRPRFSDAQCGFKAVTQGAAARLLPLVEDTGWFFDTELLILAEKLGYQILEVPVRWQENRSSHVNIFQTAAADLRGLLRLRRTLRRMSRASSSAGQASGSRSLAANNKTAGRLQYATQSQATSGRDLAR